MEELSVDFVGIVDGGGGGTDAEDGIIERTVDEYTNDRVTKVGDYAFYGCTALTEISFPSVTGIGDHAFYGCDSMVTVSFPVTGVIYSNAFDGCVALTEISFPVAESIGNYAFNGCNKLTTANFPAVVSIYLNAFRGCSTMTALIIGNVNQVCYLSNSNAFTDTPISNGTGYIYVPDALVDSYKAASNWSTYAKQIKPLSEYTGGETS